MPLTESHLDIFDKNINKCESSIQSTFAIKNHQGIVAKQLLALEIEWLKRNIISILQLMPMSNTVLTYRAGELRINAQRVIRIYKERLDK